MIHIDATHIVITMNIIIHSYTNQCKTIPVPPGLADFLRGTMFLYQETHTHPNMDLIVDFSRHPIHKYIHPMPKNIQPPYQEVLQQPLEIVECFHKDNYKVLDAVNKTNIPNQPPQRVFCFQYYEEFNPPKSTESTTISRLPTQTQVFMKQVLNFIQEIKEDADDVLHQILSKPNQPFCILHIRMGDQQSSQEDVSIPPILHEYINTTLIPKWGKDHIIVLSDSYAMKQYMKQTYSIPSTDFVPVHLGTTTRFLHPNHNYGTYESDIGKTLIEFIIMSKAAEIYMYSVYDWGSGFSYICSHIYDIPYTRICSA